MKKEPRIKRLQTVFNLKLFQETQPILTLIQLNRDIIMRPVARLESWMNFRSTVEDDIRQRQTIIYKAKKIVNKVERDTVQINDIREKDYSKYRNNRRTDDTSR